MVGGLLCALVGLAVLSDCARARGPAASAPAMVAADQADPSPLVKIQAFGYRRHGAPADFVVASVPQIPQGSDFVVRGKLTEAGQQGSINAARLQVDGQSTSSDYSLAQRPAFELSVPTAALRAGLHTVNVQMLQAGSKVLPFEKGIVFEVDSVAQPLPPVPRAPQPLAAAVDMCCRLGDSAAPAGDVELKPADSLLIVGWAYDPSLRSVGRRLLIVVDGARAFQADYGIARPDVAAFFKNEAFKDSGYEAVVPASTFSAGAHTVNLILLSHDGTRYFTLAKPAATFHVN